MIHCLGSNGGMCTKDRSRGEEAAFSIYFFFALFLIFDFYCGFKTFFFSTRTSGCSKSLLGKESSILSSTENAVSKPQLDDKLEFVYVFTLLAS